MFRRHRTETAIGSALVALGLLLAARAPAFFTPGNLVDVLLATLPVLIVAVGATMVMIAGDIDVSVGSTFAVASVVAGTAATMGAPLSVAALVALVTGSLIGALNGALVAYARIPSIVVTLATMVALRDGLRWVTQGAWVQDLPANFQWFGLSQSAYPVVAVGIAIIVAGLGSWGLRNLPAGRAIYATGSHPAAARLAAINTSRVRFWVLTAGGGLTGLAALLNAVRFNQIPANAGIGLEMEVIAAAVVGGTAVTGGRGTILGTALGAVLLGAMGPALTFLGVSPFWERALQGVMILSAVAMAAARERTSTRGAARVGA
jgi:rhamnose transport system permease protein